EVRNVGGQSLQSVPIERRRVVDGGVRIERAEAGIEVIVVVIHQFQGDHAARKHGSQLLMAARIATDAVAGKERFAAKEGIAGPFEGILLWQALDLKTVGFEPPLVVLGLALPLRMQEVR